MLSLFTSPQMTVQQQAINIIDKPKTAIVRQLTLEEKIKTNFYKCNTDIEWIRADNAQCLSKPVSTPNSNNIAPKPENERQPIKSSSGGGFNAYEYRSCTWWVKQWKPNIGSWGDAKNWGYAAQNEGWTVSPNPVPGAVAWSTRGYYGHVALVLYVRNGTVVIQEGNYDYNGSVRTTEVPIGEYQYIY